jgi:hypothetical protein
MGVRQVGQLERHYILLDPQTMNAELSGHQMKPGPRRASSLLK